MSEAKSGLAPGYGRVLEGKTALVTGGGRGIGAAIAVAFAQAGANVCVSDVGATVDGQSMDGTPAETVASEIRGLGRQAVTDATDVSDFAGVAGLVDSIVEAFGSLDIVVNCAGILRDRMIFNMAEDEWDSVIRVHLKGAFNLARHAGAYWKSLNREDANFRLINFSSYAGIYGGPGQPNYDAAKMGVIGLTLACSNSLVRYGVTTNAIAPAATTRMTTSIPEERRKTASFRSDRRPENVAPIVVYLASDASRWLNGRVIGAQGREITLFSTPVPLRQVTCTEEWQYDRMVEAVETSFKPVAIPGVASALSTLAMQELMSR